MHQSVTIKCEDCGKGFTVSAEDCEFYALNDLPMPKRCIVCQSTRKSECNHDGERRPAQAMHDIICAGCGKRVQVYHLPKFDRPVYCINCIRVKPEKL
jgi:CxxC-x17-CxxC domain-containing protein